METRKVENVSTIFENWKQLFSTSIHPLTTTCGMNKTTTRCRTVQNASSAVYKCYVGITSTFSNLAEVAEFMPELTPFRTMYLPTVRTV